MPEKDDFFSFDEALDELRLKEEELKRLVSEGEIRAFRDGDTMRLRKADVDNLRNELSGGEVVDLGEGTEELVFEDDFELDDTGMATEEISEMDTLLEDEIEDIGELEVEDVGEVEETEDLGELVSEEDEAPVPRRGALVAAREEEPSENVGLIALMAATAAILTLAAPVLLSARTGKVSPLAEAIAGIFGGN